MAYNLIRPGHIDRKQNAQRALELENDIADLVPQSANRENNGHTPRFVNSSAIVLK
jgi:hypothetical protein